jgi:hypothetical protein
MERGGGGGEGIVNQWNVPGANRGIGIICEQECESVTFTIYVSGESALIKDETGILVPLVGTSVIV